jgi:hypothetical protein
MQLEFTKKDYIRDPSIIDSMINIMDDAGHFLLTHIPDKASISEAKGITIQMDESVIAAVNKKEEK